LSRTAELAAFAAQLSFDDLPDSAVAHAKRCILDAIGCGLYGSTLDWSKVLVSTIGSIGAAGEARVWGTDVRLAPDAAALVNGTAVHSFELDDLHKTAIMHPGGDTLPPLLALTESMRAATGQDLVTALVTGYETGIRVGLASGLGLLHRGWHSNAVLGTFCAAAACGRLLGLDARQMEHAFGMAATQSGGLMSAQYGSMVKRLHTGRAAQSGLYAAILARSDFAGIEDIFGDRYGSYFNTFTDEYDVSPLTEGFGTKWEIEDVGFKWYSACGSSHTSIDAALLLREAYGIRPEQVRHCEVISSTATKDHVGWPYIPDSITTAQMNLSYAVAVALTYGEVTVDHFVPGLVADPALVGLAERVVVMADPSIDARGSRLRHAVRMRIELDDGRTVEQAVDHAKGSEHYPLSDGELRRKYRGLAEKGVGAERAGEIEAIIDRIEELETVADLTGQLHGKDKRL
jgi:aconitate decarboxylase